MVFAEVFFRASLAVMDSRPPEVCAIVPPVLSSVPLALMVAIAVGVAFGAATLFDVSFALGQAVPLAQSKSDFVLMGGQLEVLVSTVQRSRQTMRIVRQNLWWAAAYNAACVPLALMGWLPAWAAGLGMALSSLLVVLNALRLAQGLSPFPERHANTLQNTRQLQQSLP